MTASKVILLAKGLQRVTERHLRSNQFSQTEVEAMLRVLNNELAHRFHRLEQEAHLAEAALLDPRFKKRAFSSGQAASEVVERLTRAAAQVLNSNPEQAAEAAGAAAGTSVEESSVWGEFDDEVACLVSGENSSNESEATLEMHSYLEEPMLPRSSNPLAWWKSRQLLYPRLTQLMLARLCILATSVPSERVFSKMGMVISQRRSRLKPEKAKQIMFLNGN